MALTARPQPRSSQPPPLGWFVLASLALHGLLLAGWSAVRPVSLGENIGTAGSITLQAVLSPPMPATQLKPAHNPPKKSLTHQAHTNHNKIRHGSKPEVVAKQTIQPTEYTQTDNKPATHATQTVSVPKTALTTNNHKAELTAVNPVQRRLLLGRIHIALAEHFKYPIQAQRLGWQGTVLLGFRLTPRGHIEEIHIAQSSGYSVLDKAAVTALGKVQQVQPEEPLLISSLDLTLPVIYRIEDR